MAYVLIQLRTVPNYHRSYIFYQRNILLDSGIHCQMIDFGLTRQCDVTVTRSTKTFVPNFAAPELFGMCGECCQPTCDGCCEGHDVHRRKTVETDVYAFGCLYYAVCLKRPLFCLFMERCLYRYSLILFPFMGKTTFES